MRPGNNSVDDLPIVAPDRVRLTVQGVLRAAQAAGWTDDSLEAASGVKAPTIKGYRLDGKEPSISKALSLAVVIGPAALNPILALIGYVARPLDEADGIEPMQAIATGMHHFSVLARAAADNRIDHTEERETTEAADALIATFLPFSSAGQAA